MPALPSLIITSPRCMSSVLHHELVIALGAHIALIADGRADAPRDLPDLDYRVTGDDYR